MWVFREVGFITTTTTTTHPSNKVFGDRNNVEGLYHLAFAMTGDATETKGDSITPILLRLLNLPPWIRDRMQQIIMVLLFPKGVKHEMCLAPLLWELAKFKPGEHGEDMPVFDKTAGAAASVRLWLAFCGVLSSPSTTSRTLVTRTHP